MHLAVYDLGPDRCVIECPRSRGLALELDVILLDVLDRGAWRTETIAAWRNENGDVLGFADVASA